MMTTAYAVIKYTTTISNTATIKGYEVTLWRTDTNEAVINIAWGDLDQGTSKTTEVVFGFEYCLKVKNTGDYDSYIAWKLDESTPLPEGVTLTAQWTNQGDGTWSNEIPQNDFSAFGLVSVGGLSKPIRWTLTIGADVPRQSIDFTILLLSADTSTG